jgi:signal transduction histidine kinase
METLRILVVDDEKGMRMGILRSLKNYSTEMPDGGEVIHFELDEAASGEEALEKIDANTPQIILLDMKLPGIDGLEVLEEMSKRKLNIFTIMITAYASIQAAVKATKQGAFDFLPKPFTPDELKNSIRKVAHHLILTEKARKLSAERHKIRFNFLSVLAHELKAPINAIEGYLDILANPKLMEKVDKESYARMIDRSISRIGAMRKLIFDLLDLTRIESGEKVRVLEEVDLVNLARQSMDSVRSMAMEHSIALNLHSPENLNFWGDASEIEMILNNLISNAVKYNRDGGSVDVNLEKESEHTLISVKDTGIGMTEDESKRLFGEFIRIKNRKTQNISGTGLGLSIVKKLALAYKGNITVESVPDEGTTFRVKLAEGEHKELAEKEHIELSVEEDK